MRSWARLGRLLGASWVHHWCSWAPLGCQIISQTDSGSIFHRCWLHLGWPGLGVWGHDGTNFRSWALLGRFLHRNAIIIAEKPCLPSPTIIFSPSGPAISAQYIRCLPQGCRACSVGCPCSASCRLLCPANCLCCQLLLPCQLPLPCQQSVFKGSFCFNGSWASIASSICVHRFGPWLPPAGAIDLQGQLGSNGSRVTTVHGVRW